MKIFNGIKIEDFLKDKQIVKVYVGKDNYCRCGCGGDYIYNGDDGFKRVVNAAVMRCNSMRESSGIAKRYMEYLPKENEEGFINIPCYNNLCYCIYFKQAA